MQAKDVPELPILAFLASPAITGTIGATFYDQADGMPYTHSLSRALPNGTPIKVAKAKIRSMIKRGLVGVCRCGCRGDVTITPVGLSLLATPQPTPAAESLDTTIKT